jgi:hypothetical protein
VTLAVSTIEIEPIHGSADYETSDGYSVLIKLVHALAKRQAQLDLKFSTDAANDNEPRTIH